MALILGALHTLAFAPTPHGGWLQLPVLAALFCLSAHAGRRRAAFCVGLAFGIGNFTTGVWWLYVSMHQYGGMPAPLAALAVLLFAIYLGVYPGLSTSTWYALRSCKPKAGQANGTDATPASSAAHRLLSSSPGGALLSAGVFAASWAIGEWLRGMVFTGFPWLASGYAQVDGPLAGVAPLAGVYGVGFAVALGGALLGQCLFALLRRQNRTAVYAALCLAVLIGAGYGVGALRFTQVSPQWLSVRLLQGNVAQDMKFSQSGFDQSMALYQHLITEKPVDLVVTPETALPILINDTPAGFAQATRSFVNSTGTSVLLGAAGVVERDGKPAYTNSTFGLTPGQSELYRYDKHHLVPFGEFVPWGFRWFVNLMQIPLGDFARGAVVQTPFTVKGERFAINICYEDLFGEEIARNLRHQLNPASVLVNSTNLGWFGDTIALDQHLQISRMRALEMQRPVLRATNTGTTAAIDAYGRVYARLPTFTAGALDTRVQGSTGLTPYIRFGNLPVLILSVLLLVLGGLSFGNRRRPRSGTR